MQHNERRPEGEAVGQPFGIFFIFQHTHDFCLRAGAEQRKQEEAVSGRV